MNNSNYILGAHVSAAGGIDKAVERAAAIGCNAVQVFSGSPRVWQRAHLDTIDTAKIAAKQAELNVTSIVTHSLYLINLASDKPELVQKSKAALEFDLRFDSLVKGLGIVVHLGSHQGRGWEAVKDQVLQVILEILGNSPSDSHFLIENAAGQQGKIGGELAEVKWLIENVQSTRLGWCLDTCHAFAAGYSLDPKAEHSALGEIEALGLQDSLSCVHVNDSRDPFMSGRDRHDNLGDGSIPTEDFKAFLNHPFIVNQPLILEVPGIEKTGPDAENVERLKTLLA